MAEPKHASGAPLWGVAAEFDTEAGMLAALRALRRRSLGRLDAFSPVPIPDAVELLDLPDRPMDRFSIGAACIGAVAMFAMCTYATIWGYRFDIGGRPLFSWPAFVVPSISFGMLLGAIAVYTVMLVLNRLPRLNHPVFNIRDFTRATSDRFFVAVEARDDTFNADAVEAAFAALDTRPRAVRFVPR